MNYFHRGVLILALTFFAVFNVAGADKPPSKKKWTLAYYINGTTDLCCQSSQFVKKLAEQGSDQNVNIVVLWALREMCCCKGDEKCRNCTINDCPDNCVPAFDINWKTTNVYYVTKGFIPTDANKLKYPDNDPDLGNAKTISDYLLFCAENFPATNMSLTIWGHGGGIVSYESAFKFDRNKNVLIPSDGPPDEKMNESNEKLKELFFDQLKITNVFNLPDGFTTKDMVMYDAGKQSVLFIDEITTGLKDYYDRTKQKLAILKFEGCFKQALENTLAFAPYAKVHVGSESQQFVYSLADPNYLPFVKARPDSGAIGMAKAIVNRFEQRIKKREAECYDKKFPANDYTFSAVHLADLLKLQKDMENVFTLLITELKESESVIVNARKRCWSYDDWYNKRPNANDPQNFYFIDFVQFLKEVNKLTTNQKLKQSVTSLITKLKKAIIANKPGLLQQSENYHGRAIGSNGLSIFFPETKPAFDRAGMITYFRKLNPNQLECLNVWEIFLKTYRDLLE